MLAPLAAAESIYKYNEIAATYLGYALPNPGSEISKPVGEHSRKLWRSCVSQYRKEKCPTDSLNEMLRSSLAANENLILEYSNLRADLQIIFADQNVVKFKKGELDKIFESAFRDSADPDCALYYRVENSVVADRVILVSVDAPANKQRMCLAIQFFQSLGLNFDRNSPSFAKLWVEGEEALSVQPENQFDQLVGGLKVFAMIHMCPEIQAGMRRDDVIAVLRRSKCWQGIFLK